MKISIYMFTFIVAILFPYSVFASEFECMASHHYILDKVVDGSYGGESPLIGNELKPFYVDDLSGHVIGFPAEVGDWKVLETGGAGMSSKLQLTVPAYKGVYALLTIQPMSATQVALFAFFDSGIGDAITGKCRIR